MHPRAVQGRRRGCVRSHFHGVPGFLPDVAFRTSSIATSSALSASASTSGLTPTPSQLVLVTGFLETPMATESTNCFPTLANVLWCPPPAIVVGSPLWTELHELAQGSAHNLSEMEAHLNTILHAKAWGLSPERIQQKMFILSKYMTKILNDHNRTYINKAIERDFKVLPEDATPV